MSESSPDSQDHFVESVRDDGVGIFVSFVKQKDRFGHVVALIQGDECTPLFVTLEGTDEEDWPASPPLLLTTGDRDLEIPFRYEENALLYKMLKFAKHPNVELHELQGFDHGNMVEPGVLLMTRFIRKHAGGK